MSTIAKTLMHSGIEIRRSDEMTEARAYIHLNPMQWVVDFIGGKWGFKTLRLAQQFIDSEIAKEANQTHSDWSGNYWIIRPVDGKFTEVAISRAEYEIARGRTPR
jgi:hypothetical protein